MKPAAWIIAAAIASVTLCSAQNQDLGKVEIHTLPVQGSIYMLVGAGSNITVQVAKDGILLVDSEYPELSGKILDAIR